MPGQGSDGAGIATAAGQLKARLDALVRLQGELVRRRARKTAAGGGVAFAGAVLLGVAMLAGLAAIAAGMATVLDVWLSILILFGGLFILGVGLVTAGVAMLKRADAPKVESDSAVQTTALGVEKDAEPDKRTDAQIREEIAAERKALDEATQGFRNELIGLEELRGQLPALAVGAFAAGFVLSGGIGATVRTLMRKRYQRRKLAARLPLLRPR